MAGIYGETVSVCPECLRPLVADREEREGDLYLLKDCPDHGHFEVMIWKGAQHWLEWSRPVCAPSTMGRFTRVEKGCPLDCGICDDHLTDTCSVILEVTNGCNIACPVCFADANVYERTLRDPDLEEVRGMLKAVLATGGPYPLILSGGEPTIRDDLPDICALARSLGFGHIQVNTNGIRIARQIDYLARLKAAGATVIFLQFDGISDEVYRFHRGADLFHLKEQALVNCRQVRLGVVLVPTIVPGVNDHQVGAIIQFAKAWIPTVKGVNFQPVSYFGRAPAKPTEARRMTIPELLLAIEEQTGGELKAHHFTPPTCEDAHCSFTGYAILGEDGRLLPTTRFQPSMAAGTGSCCGTKAGPAPARAFIQDRLRERQGEKLLAIISDEPQTGGGGSGCCKAGAEVGSWESLYERAEDHYLFIAGMAFMDAMNLESERLRRCCIHVITPEQRLIPFCAHEVSNTRGERLYPRKEVRGDRHDC